jgi:hypothetical protein
LALCAGEAIQAFVTDFPLTYPKAMFSPTWLSLHLERIGPSSWWYIRCFFAMFRAQLSAYESRQADGETFARSRFDRSTFAYLITSDSYVELAEAATGSASGPASSEAVANARAVNEWMPSPLTLLCIEEQTNSPSTE